MQKAISVVIPLYNKEKYIRRTLNSVLNQTFQDFECIIIDSSTDASTDIVRQYSDPRIIHITRERTRAAQGRNLGACIAKSDFIAFLDADDEWQPDHLETLLNLKRKFPDAGLFSTPYIKLKQNGKPMVMLFVGIPKPPWEGYLENYLGSCSRGDEPVSSSSCAIPRQIFTSIGGFPEDLEYGEDQFLWGKIALSHPVAFSWNGLAIYHTEASDRICNNPHAVMEHPFSTYLKQELVRGTIPKKFQRASRRYIRRKRYAEFFSSLIMLGSSAGCDDVTEIEKKPPVQQHSGNFISRSLKKISSLARRLYNSSFQDIFRRTLCKLYGCYDPGSILSDDT